MTNKGLELYYDFPFFIYKKLQEVLQAHKNVFFLKGDFILEEGKTANEYYILEKCLARSFVNNFSGNEVTTQFFVENDILIEVSFLFQRIQTQENILCKSNCECWKFDFEAFQELFHKFPISENDEGHGCSSNPQRLLFCF